MNVTHPSPERHNMSPKHMAFGMCGAPLAWFLQMYLSDIISSHNCYPQENPLNRPLWNTDWLLAILCLAALATGIAASASAYHQWKRLNEGHDKEHVANIGEGRSKFMAFCALALSAMFILAIIFTSLGLLLVSPCGS